MSIYYSGQTVTFKFIFSLDGQFADPIFIDQQWSTRNVSATPFYGGNQTDIIINILKGESGGGQIVGGPYSYNAQSATPDYGIALQTQFETNTIIKQNLTDGYITRESSGIYNFIYKIPENLFPGKYTVFLETTLNEVQEIRELNFYVKDKSVSGPILVEQKQVNQGVGTLLTSSPHGLKSGEIVKITDVDNYFDGIRTVLSVDSNVSVSFYLDDITLSLDKASVIPTGYIFRDKNSGPSVIAGHPPVSGSGRASTVFQPMNPFATNSVLLIGHADSAYLALNEIKRVQSVQEAINILNGDTRSPLLRGVIDCYNAGCEDINIMISAPMSEYVENINALNTPMASFISEKMATPSVLNFYEKYHERLQDTYEIAKSFDFIDIVVPLGASFIRCGSVNFVRQLADFCSEFYKNSSTFVFGIIGSRTNGINETDVVTMSDPNFVKNILKDSAGNSPNEKDFDGNILDVGRHVMLYYGEAVFNYPNLGTTYSSSISAAVAGQLSNWPVYMGLNRKTLKGAYSQVGIELSSLQIAKLHNNKINTLIKSNRSRRAVPYQVLISEDKTLAKDGSSLANIPQVRLVAMVMSEIISVVNSVSGKFSQDIIKERISGMFKMLKNSSPSILKDYRFEMYADKRIRGKYLVEIDLISSHSLKKINFSIVAGPGA